MTLRADWLMRLQGKLQTGFRDKRDERENRDRRNERDEKHWMRLKVRLALLN